MALISEEAEKQNEQLKLQAQAWTRGCRCVRPPSLPLRYVFSMTFNISFAPPSSQEIDDSDFLGLGYNLEMLKSTYSKHADAQENSQQATESELPPGWSAHIAPTGKSERNV